MGGKGGIWEKKGMVLVVVRTEVVSIGDVMDGGILWVV